MAQPLTASVPIPKRFFEHAPIREQVLKKAQSKLTRKYLAEIIPLKIRVDNLTKTVAANREEYLSIISDHRLTADARAVYEDLVLNKDSPAFTTEAILRMYQYKSIAELSAEVKVLQSQLPEYSINQPLTEIKQNVF